MIKSCDIKQVQAEIRKKWERYQLRRTGGSSRSNRSSNHTNSTYFTRGGRTSMHSIHSTTMADTRTEIINGNNGSVAIGNGGPTMRERMYSRGSVPRMSPEKDGGLPGDLSVEADICKMEDEAYPLTETKTSVIKEETNGESKPLLLENGCHLQEETKS